MCIKIKLITIAMLIAATVTAQNTTIRDFLQKLPLRSYTLGNATITYFADATPVDSAAFTDLYLNKIMPSAKGTVLESHIRVFKSAGCATQQQMREMLLKECKQYMNYTITNVRVIKDQQTVWGEAPIVIQGELITESYKFYRTCVAYADREQFVFLSLVYANDAGADYHNRFTVSWADNEDKIGFLKATLQLPSRFVAEPDKEGNELFIMRCDQIGQNAPHVRAQNFTDNYDPDLDMYYLMIGEEDPEKKITYTSAKNLYEDLLKELEQEASLPQGATIYQLQKPGQQSVSGPTEAYRVTYMAKSETDGTQQSVEEVLVGFNKNIYRFRLVYPRTGAVADSQESAFFNKMRSIIYALKPDK